MYVPVSAGGLAFMYNLIDNSGQPRHRPQADPPRGVQDLHRRDHEVERPRDRRDEPAARGVQPRHRPGDPQPTARARASCSRSSASRSRQDVWSAFVAERIRQRSPERRRRLPAGSARLELAAEGWGRSVSRRLRRRHRERRRGRQWRRRTRSRTSPPVTRRCGASRSRRCRTPPVSSPSPTRTT